MSRIPALAIDQAAPEAAEILRRVETEWGGVWNVARVLANAPASLAMLRAMHHELARCSLSRKDREVIDLTMAVVNGCHYCVPAHILLAREGGLDDADIKAIVEGGAVADPRGRVIQALTHRLVEKKGKLGDAEFDEFQTRGASQAQMIEVIAEIAHCTLTNYTNRLAGTELDDQLEGVTV